MQGFELKAARELLGLSQEEAAKYIGGVSQRSWAYWENGSRTLKADVIGKVNLLLERRREIIRWFVNGQDVNKAKKASVIYYSTPEYSPSILDWRFSQSLARTLALDFGAALVEFDYDDFQQYIAGFRLKDTPASRSEWAAYKATRDYK